jgi:hypothetical protein
MQVSLLTQKELKAHDLLIELFGAMDKLSPQGQEKVYQRWLMLKLMEPHDVEEFKRNLHRVHAPVTNPDRITLSSGGAGII